MSKILMLFSQPIIDTGNINALICFYEGFANELCKNGNTVKCVNLRDIQSVCPDFICGIKKFDPDIIFAFNNRITPDIIKNTNCPICVMNADGLNLWSNVYLIKQNIDRYYLFSFWQSWEQNEYKNLGLEKKRIVSLHMATPILSKQIKKTANISFIGSSFPRLTEKAIKKIKNNFDLQQDALKVMRDGNLKFDDFFEKYKSFFDNDIVTCFSLLDPRVSVLNSISDLGLDLYGFKWDELPDEYLLLKSMYKKQPVYIIEDNQKIYNSSHINISICHPQCKGYASPWRVFDIMASNGLLISSYSKLLEELTKGIVDIPMFKSPYDARELCKYALENPSYCKDIIAASNQFVDKYARWQDNIQKIQEVTNVKLVNKTSKKGKQEVVCVMCTKQAEEQSHKCRFLKSFGKRIRLLLYFILLMLAQIPVLDLLQRNKSRKVLRQKIEKYWR